MLGVIITAEVWLSAAAAIALLLRLAMLAYGDMDRGGGPGEAVALLTFLVPPVGIAAWAWLRTPPTTIDRDVDITSDVIVTVGGLLLASLILVAAI